MWNDIDAFYELIEELKEVCCQYLEERSWEQITLRNIDGHNPYWEKCRKGIYFFFDLNEKRSNGITPRVVRVGANDVKKTESNQTLWERLEKHRGNANNNGGNRSNSVFRSSVYGALFNRNQNFGGEGDVSDYIRKLPFLVVKVDLKEDRRNLEKNLIALLSNIKRRAVRPPCPDEPSPDWLGRYSSREKVRQSGLWNNHHVNERYDPNCLDRLEEYINSMA